MPSLTIGSRLQVLYWPRWELCFYRLNAVKGVYRWIVYLWPIELRWFAR